jgi:tetratricopeptide (TPR) repeat protein
VLASGLALGGCVSPRDAAVAASKVVPPANPVAIAKMVQGVIAAKDPNGTEQAIQLLREAVALDPYLWEARYDLGVVLSRAGDLAGAEDALATAAKSDEGAEEVALALAEVRQRRGEHKAAADGLGDFVEAHPQALAARTLYVACLRDAGQIDKAIREAREVLVHKPGDASALAELALSHLAKGERDEASLLAKQALDSDAHSAVAERATGMIALSRGDDATAFLSFSKATQADPKDTTARLNMGSVLLRAGAYAKAAEQFRAILQVLPDDSDAILGLACALKGEGAQAKDGAPKVQEARTLLEKLLTRSPHNVGALFNLGVLYADVLKRPDDARSLFQRFLSDAPTDHPARAEASRYIASLGTSTPASGGPGGLAPANGPPPVGAPQGSASPAPPAAAPAGPPPPPAGGKS